MTENSANHSEKFRREDDIILIPGRLEEFEEDLSRAERTLISRIQQGFEPFRQNLFKDNIGQSLLIVSYRLLKETDQKVTFTSLLLQSALFLNEQVYPNVYFGITPESIKSDSNSKYEGEHKKFKDQAAKYIRNLNTIFAEKRDIYTPQLLQEEWNDEKLLESHLWI